MTDRPCRTELLNHINAVSFAVDAMNFGPLTIDTATASCSEYWKWINEPWPWQEGGC